MVINGKQVVVVIRTLGQPVSDPLPFGVNRLEEKQQPFHQGPQCPILQKQIREAH